MLGTGKAAHIHAEFGEDPLRRQCTNPGNRVNQCDRLLPGQGSRGLVCAGWRGHLIGAVGVLLVALLGRIRRAQPPRNLVADPADSALQGLNLLQMLPQQEAVVGRDFARQGPLQLR
jgi:hypothetical protein